ncbi:MAG: glycosyltransferase family 9 protein [Thermodesulfobacteriota bacterium]
MLEKKNDISGIAPHKILVCQLKQIGDVILSTPVIQILKKRFPAACIHVLTEKKCAPVLENHPDIDRIWAIDKKRLRPFWRALAYYRKVAGQRFDLIVDLQQLPRCKFVVAMSKTPVRLTFPPPWYNRPLYTHWSNPVHGYAARFKASFLAPLGIEWNEERPRIYLTNEEKKWAQGYLRETGLQKGQKLIVAAPGHKAANRRWPAENFGNLINLAGGKRPDWKWLLVYGPGERETAEKVAEAAENTDALLPIQDIFDLRRIAALIDRAYFFLGNCSAPRHMAVGVDTPSLTVLGASSPAWTFPSPEHQDISSDIECQPCNRESCRYADIPCLSGLAPEKVWQRIERLFI